MKGVMSVVPQHILDERRRTGADQWDEMWEGVLHITPTPNKRHNRLGVQICNWLDHYWAQPGANEVDLQVNVASVGGWPHDYRIPDIVLMTPDRFSIDRDDCFEGAPTVVVEIRSPGDETWEKMPFYARIGVPEVWVIDRDTRVPQVFRLAGAGYEELLPGADGWIRSPATGVCLRTEPDAKLGLQMGDDPATQRAFPER